MGMPGISSPALAQCVTVGTDVTCTNTGALGNGVIISANTANGAAKIDNSGTIGNNAILSAVTGPGNATIINSGTIGNLVTIFGTTTDGAVRFTNSGSIGSQANISFVASPTGSVSVTNTGSIGANSQVSFTAVTGSGEFVNSGSIGSGATLQSVSVFGNAGLTNSGSIGGNSIVNTFTSAGNASFTNSGSIGDVTIMQTSSISGNASFTNSGSLGVTSTVIVNSSTGSSATLTNSGSIGNGSNLSANAPLGNATVTNSGTLGNTTILSAISTSGNASVTNSGTMGSFGLLQAISSTGNTSIVNSGSTAGNAFAFTNTGSSSLVNSGTIGGNINVGSGSGNASLINSGLIGGAGTLLQVTSTSGTASLRNAGFIAENIVVVSATGVATLTNLAGSRIAGSITLGGPAKTLEFIGGNYLYTLNTLNFVNINTHGAPFVASGNIVAVLDPTMLALEDRSLMNFTGGVASMLQDRFGGMGIPGGGTGRAAPLSFAPAIAPDTAARLDAAHDAFAGLPSLSMSYASDASRVRNANAAYLKAPVAAVPVYDTTVWASGFGGERRQSAFDAVQGARDTAYGGTIGVDRQFTPDLRLGLFAGGGASKLRTDFNIQNSDSEYGFAGGYGRWDRRDYFVDFALFGGGLNTKSTRLVANNLAANGLEIANASYNGWFISPDVTVGYRFFNPLGTVTPKARVRYVGGTLDGYTETGSAQGLAVGARHISDVEERLGVEFAMITAFAAGSVRASLEFSGVGLQRVGDNTISTVVLAQNLAFTTPGRREAYGGAVNAGLDWRPKSNLSFFVSAEGMATNDSAWSAVGKGGVRVGF
jgi:uncharacterized protein with beta-barrel porin domain